jgi:hypothetical protein
MDASLIAPCGINCALCYAYQRDKNHCGGCRSENIPFDSCRSCIIRNCEMRLQNGWSDCGPCEKPCARLKQLDKRYRAKYNTNLFENLACIRDDGMDAFLKRQAAQWTCPDCGALLCMHREKCLSCQSATQ